jgi:hypothetical protein
LVREVAVATFVYCHLEDPIQLAARNTHAQQPHTSHTVRDGGHRYDSVNAGVRVGDRVPQECSLSRGLPVNTVDVANQVVILGAGPAGLTAAYELSNLGLPCVVLEKDRVVGGLARTVEYKKFRFDIGGHRFYTKVSLVQRIWRDILGDDLLSCKRLSRIYDKSKFFQYPLQPMDAFRGLSEAG